MDVTNTGHYSADEVVQIYVRTPDSPASLERPAKRLKGFQRVTIPRGQTRTVNIDIDCADLWFWDMDEDRMTYDPGRYVFEFGSSSQDIRGSVTATMSGTLKRALKTVWASCDASVLHIGKTAKASFSACMNDDSFFDTALAVWRSNNPSVATVDPDGTVRARAMGVATITCSVTIYGKTVEDSFAVKVMPDLGVRWLKVGDKTLKPGDASSVSYLLEPGKAPKVEAEAADPMFIDVTVKQADVVPGTAVITLHDGITGDGREMVVNFGTEGVSDSFKKGKLNKAWKWVREDADAWKLSSDGLTLTAGKGDIAQGGNSATNILLQSANTDWTAETKMRCEAAPAPPAQNAQLQLLVEENGQQKSVANLPLDGIVGEDNVLWLRLDKEGDTYTAWYSVDGKQFEKMGTAQAVLKDVQAGVIACEGEMPMMMRGGGPRMGGMPMPQAAPLKVSFSDFKLVSRGRK